MEKNKVFIFDPAPAEDSISRVLDGTKWEAVLADDFQQAKRLLDEQPFFAGLVVIGECRDKSFLYHVEELLRHYQEIEWITVLPQKCLTEPGANGDAMRQLISQYCYDYHSLPLDAERLSITLGHACGMAEIVNRPHSRLEEYPGKFGIIGNSAMMQRLFRQIGKVAQQESSVLIEGETGTGKELIANAIHHNSSRAKKPLVAVNCGALPESLVQSELFGYEKGAFTGAHQVKIGRIEAAAGGTLFLDEIGDLPLPQQANLLRFLQEKSIERVGGVKKIEVDARVIAATHVDLREAVRRGAFREDLYYRLRVLHLEAPPLREREGDIELLAWWFYQKYAAENRHKTRGFCLRSLQAIKEYSWPGNVREMSNCIHHALVMSESRLLTPEDLGLERRSRHRTLPTLEEARVDAEKQAILSSLRYYNFNVTKAAEILGVSRVTLYRLLDKYQLKVKAQLQ